MTSINRRSALLAGVSALAVPAIPALAADPDSRIHQLVARYWVLEEECKAIVRRQTAIYDAVEPLYPIPEGDHYDLYVRRKDPVYIAACEARNRALEEAGATDCEKQIDVVVDAQFKAFRELRDTRAATLRGMLVKAHVGRHTSTMEPDPVDIDGLDPEAQMFVSLMWDLERLV